MNENAGGSIHWSFWLIGAVALVWYVMGAINFVMQMNPDMIGAYRESEQSIILGRPAWATGAFAVSQFVGVIGCLLLLLRKPAAIYCLGVSLLGVIVTVGHSLSVDVQIGAGELLGFVLMPVVMAIFLVWYAKHIERKGWVK